MSASVDRKELVMSPADCNSLAGVVEVMRFLSEATNILQREASITSNRVDSLENVLMETTRETAAINAPCEHLLTSLCRRFVYLCTSDVYKAATALDPRVKLSFTDHERDGKVFLFTSTDVKESVKSFLPQSTTSQDDDRAQQATVDTPGSSAAKKPRLLDFYSIDDDITARSRVDDVNTELQMFFDQPRLELFSVPCSSAPVERLFSKAGVVLSQRRSRIGGERLEKLIFLK